MERVFPRDNLCSVVFIIINYNCISQLYQKCICLYDSVSLLVCTGSDSCLIEYEAQPSGICRTTNLRRGQHPVYLSNILSWQHLLVLYMTIKKLAMDPIIQLIMNFPPYEGKDHICLTCGILGFQIIQYERQMCGMDN